VENIIVIYLSRIGSEFLPANFSLSYFVCPFLGSAHLFPPIRVYHCFTYKYHCTAPYSSVLFWTQNRLDEIKVIACAHPCHHFHRRFFFLPGATPKITSYNAGVAKIYSATNSIARF
jgi:hypothetical protein